MSGPTELTDAITINSQTLHNINMSNVSKLVATNYLMWSLQVHALLDGYGLAGHLDGSSAAPSHTITTAGTISENPAFLVWKRQDRLIYSALISAISVSLQPLVSRTITAAQIWQKLSATYAMPSRGHIRQLKTQLKNWTKGGRVIDEYVQGFTTRFDQLAILGKPVDHEDQIELILGGLPEEYKPIIDQIEGKDNPPSITEVHERLLNHEGKLQSSIVAISPSVPVSANAVQQSNNNRRNNNNSNRSRYNNNNNNNNNSSSMWQPVSHNNNNNRSDNHTSRPYLGKCQFCHVQGHSARRFPHLQSLQPPTLPPSNTPFRPW